ncbi:MAG TPA: metabolite traffic protein EboE [Bryobacteraceae bacterium]
MHTRKGFELTYCTNIHAAEGWPQVFENLKRYAPELRSRLQPQDRFGLGLRLANNEALELLSGSNLENFAQFLRDSGLYVALMNGFPYGWFHERRLKDQVFAPDWHMEERVNYTLRLLKILRRLLPEGLDGGISTCPLSYKRWNDPGRPNWDLLVQNIVQIAAAMFASGRDIHLDIEPEPDGLVETTDEFIHFFEGLLHAGTPLLAKSAQLTTKQAEQALRQHIAFCFDVCHSTVEYEEPRIVLDMLRKAGVRIGRVQISSAVKIARPAQSEARQHLAALADPVYLHQTIGERERFADWPEALDGIENAQSPEWRVHYHVPLFMESYGELGSTQSEVRKALAELHRDDVRHLEIETYTWGVLPFDLRLDLVDSIEREYRWVMAQL